MQSKRDKTFSQFDYGGTFMNLLKYGHVSPPKIDLSNIKDVPIAMFVGSDDTLSVPEGAKWALKSLPKETEYFYVQDWDHASFGVGKDMSYFDEVLKQLKKYNP